MKKTRILSLLLCLLLVAGMCLTACQTQDSEESTPAESTAETSKPGSDSAENSLYLDANGDYTLDNLYKDLDVQATFGKTEFRVCIYNAEVQTTYYSEEIVPDLYDTTDDAISKAVKERNDTILSKYGVTIVGVPVKDVQTAVAEDVQTAGGSDGAFDAVMPFMSACATLAQDGMLYDLNQYDGKYLHLESPWWDQAANSALSIGHKLYFTIGDLSIMQKITSIAITFNKQMYRDSCMNDYGDLYQLVRDKEWTFDKLYEMGRSVTADSDGTPGMTYEDTWGLSTSNNDAIQYYLGSGESLIRKDAQDYPILHLGKEQNSINVAQKTLEILEKGDEWAMNCQQMNTTGGAPATWTASLAVFGENRCLFRTTAFSAIKKLRAYEGADDFGIVPMPLMYEGQDTYYTPSSSRFAYGICIPKNAPDPEFSAFMMEALSCYAKNTVAHAYYDVVLKSRDSKDSESEEMLDNYIFNNIVYDLGVIYDFGNVSSMFASLMARNSISIVSDLETIHDNVIIAIDNCVENYELDF